MKIILNTLLLLFIILPISVIAQDPADSWLVYGVAKGGGKRVTWVNATWVVPDFPASKCTIFFLRLIYLRNSYNRCLVFGNAPGFWFGIEPEPAMDLIQPILAWY